MIFVKLGRGEGGPIALHNSGILINNFLFSLDFAQPRKIISHTNTELYPCFNVGKLQSGMIFSVFTRGTPGNKDLDESSLRYRGTFPEYPVTSFYPNAPKFLSSFYAVNVGLGLSKRA